jgi:WD40-like Beta Propeller Repeat
MPGAASRGITVVSGIGGQDRVREPRRHDVGQKRAARLRVVLILSSAVAVAAVLVLAGCGSSRPPSTDTNAQPRAPDTPVTVTTTAAPTTGVAGRSDLAVAVSDWVGAVSPKGDVRWRTRVDDSVRYGPEPTDVAPVEISGTVGPRPLWSPDRRWIAFSAGINEDEYGVHLVSSRGGSTRAVWAPSAEGGASGPLDFRWSPNSKWLAYTAQGAGVVVSDRQGHWKALRLRQFDVWNNLWADWLDGSRLAVIGVDRSSRLVLVEAEVRRGTARVVATLAPYETDFGAELSGDHRLIAWWTSQVKESAAGTLSTIRTDGTDSRVVGRFRGLNAAVPDYAGSRLAILSSQGLYLAPGTHPPVLVDRAAQNGWTAPAWDPNYTKLAYLRNAGVWVRDLRSGTSSPVLEANPADYYAFDW